MDNFKHTTIKEYRLLFKLNKFLCEHNIAQNTFELKE